MRHALGHLPREAHGGLTLPFFGPLALSAPASGGDPRVQAFIKALQSRGAQGVTSYPGPGGAGTGALGYTAPGALTGAGPLDLSQQAFLEPAGGIPGGAGGGPGESLTGALSQQQAALGLGHQAACFPASMQVVMADGTRQSIAQVRPDDLVASWDEDRARQGDARVVRVTASAPVEDLRRIDGLIVSDWHRLGGHDKWVRAIYVAPGDKLWTTEGLHEVQRIQTPLPAEPVWNLSVEPTHTFYIWDGERAWLVHNDGGGGDGGGAGGAAGEGLGGDPGGTAPGAAPAAAGEGEGVGTAGAAAGPAAGDDPGGTAPGGVTGTVGGEEGNVGAPPAAPAAGEGEGAGSPRPGLASLGAIAAARASLGGRIGGAVGTAAGFGLGLPGLGVAGAALGGVIGAGGRIGGAGIGVGFGLGNAPAAGPPASIGPAVGGPSK